MSMSATIAANGEAASDDVASAFRHSLSQLTRTTWVWPTLVAANMLVFGAFCLSNTQNIFEPTTLALLEWGGNYSPKTFHGEAYRLFTSTFMHIGVIHLLLNMAILAQIGGMVERMTGNWSFLAGYIITGLAGSLASVAWNTGLVSAGASGSVFGVYGMLLGFLMRSHGSVPREVLQPLLTGAAIFFGYNIFYGLSHAGIDNAAHFGGLFAGILCGLVLAHPLDSKGAAGRNKRMLALIAGSALVLMGTWTALPKGVSLEQDFARFSTFETKILERYSAVLEQGKQGKIEQVPLAAIFADELLPAWRAEQAHLKSPQIKILYSKTFLDYIDAREQHWSLLENALRTDDDATFEKSQAVAKDLERLIKTLNPTS